jgi:YD repeat-containing protein
VPHLTGITNNIQTAEGYNFGYTYGATLTSPWGASFGSTTQLSSVTIPLGGTSSLSYSLTYDSTGSSSLAKVVFPYGGYLSWDYTDGTYSGSRKQREVWKRYLAMDGVTPLTYTFGGPPSSPTTPTHDSNNTMRQAVSLNDADTIGQKLWTFALYGISTRAVGLLTQYQGKNQSTGAILQQVDTTWTVLSPPYSSPFFGPYISKTITTLDVSGTPVSKQVEQTIDVWGNMTSMKAYDFGVTSAPRRTYTNTYLNTSAYAALYINNRLLTSTVLEGGVTTTLVTNSYDTARPLVTVTGVRQFDPAFTNVVFNRGVLTSSVTAAGQARYVTSIDITGNVLAAYDQTGVSVTNNTNSATNFAAPSALTVGSLSSSFNYAPSLIPNSSQGPNGDTATTTFDSYARPASSTSSTGATTYFTYSTTLPAKTLAYTNGRVARTTLDGFGRTIKAESGTGTYSGGVVAMGTVVSTVDTQYAPCACSPMAKLSKTSRPYAPGGTVYWTSYTYDALGRTTVVTAPDGASQTTYLYTGANVKTTDAAGKWKTFVTDAMGNLTQVQETDPTLGAVNTNYSYDVLNRLRTVSMPRGSTTQTRTFTYTGGLLTSATNPENGTVNRYYNGDNTLNYKVDAKGQATVYSYDWYKRVIQISKYPSGYTPGGTNYPDPCQQVTYNYDNNP